MSASLRSVLLWALCAPLPLTAAETAYVIDKLLVGVHEDKDLDSAIVKVLPTGTRLEVLERDGELAYVVDPEQVKGWVDGAYLTDQPPAELRIPELERAKAALETRIKALEQAAGESGGADASTPGAGAEQIEALTRENTELKGKLSDERLRSGKLQSEVAALRAEVKDAAAPPDARVLEIERVRDDLARDLAVTRERLAEFQARATLNDSAALLPLVLRDYLVWILAILGAIAVLAFGAGIYVIDLLNRRRHGGFRV